MSSRWKWGLGVFGTLIVAIALYVWLADVPVAEMADLASEGGNDDRHSLGTEGDDEPPALIERADLRVRPFELELDEKGEDYQAVVAYQGAFAYVYPADRSLCPDEGDRCDWMRPPRLEQDSRIPLVVARQGRTGSALRDEVRNAIGGQPSQLSVTPLIQALLSAP